MIIIYSLLILFIYLYQTVSKMLIIFQSLLILLLSNVKKILFGAFEVFTSTLFKTFNGFASTFFYNFNVAISYREISSFSVLIIEIPLPSFDGSKFLSHTFIFTEHVDVISFKMLLLFLLDYETQVFYLSFSSLRHWFFLNLFDSLIL